MYQPVHWTPVTFPGHYDSSRPGALDGYTAATGVANRTVTLRRSYSASSWKSKGSLRGWTVWVDGREDVSLGIMKLLKEAKGVGAVVVEQMRREAGDPSTDTIVEKVLNRPLTANQRHVLRKMIGDSGIRRAGVAYNGQWEVGCGWLFENLSTTVKLMEGLYKRGMVSRSALADRNGYYRYRVTEAGRTAAEKN